MYEPLVITAGTNPAVAPVRPRLPKDAVVNLMFGFNGNNLELAAASDGAQPGRDPLGTLGGAKCVNGLGDSLFGQVAYCNSVPFYAAAGRAIEAGGYASPRPAGRRRPGRRARPRAASSSWTRTPATT